MSMETLASEGWAELERQVEALLQAVQSLAAEKDQLRTRLAELERELAASRTALGHAGVKQQELAKLESERSELRERVESLADELERLVAEDSHPERKETTHETH